jgi:NADH dehydrogenase FAD-containing subunit
MDQPPCYSRRLRGAAAIVLGLASSFWNDVDISESTFTSDVLVSAFSPLDAVPRIRRVQHTRYHTDSSTRPTTWAQWPSDFSALSSTKDTESETNAPQSSDDKNDNNIPPFSEGVMSQHLKELKQLLSDETHGISSDPQVIPVHDMNREELVDISDPKNTEEEHLLDDTMMRLVSSEVGVKNFLSNPDQKLSVTLELAKEARLHAVPRSSDIPLDVLLSRTLDTVEDVAVHLRRIPDKHGTKELTEEQDQSRKTVVVLGSGWSSHALMKVVDTNKIRLVVVSPVNHFTFTPMLASAAVGTVEYRSMTEAVRAANPCIDQYLEGKATDVNVANKTVTVKLNSLLDGVREGEPPELTLSYDHLIVSVGCKIDDKGVTGADKALRLKTLDDARKLRQAVGECFEFSSRPDVAGPDMAEERRKRSTFLIVGGGPTGVETAGELHDLAVDITRPNKGVYPNLKNDIRVIVAHSGPSLVPQFEPRLRDEALKSLKKKGVEVILNTYVTEVGDGYAKLSTKKFDENGEVIGRDEYTIDTGLTVWAAGTTPVSFVDKLLGQLPDEARNRDGRVNVDKFMRPVMMDGSLLGSVLVLGDAAAFPEGDELISRHATLPQTAQVAGQQGAYVARLLNRGYSLDTTPPSLPSNLTMTTANVFDDPVMNKWLEMRDLTTANPFVFLNLGILAYLGGGEALSQVQLGDVPIFSYFGSVAFVLWRSVYLVKQVATRNRVLVTFDWIKSTLFGRDMTRF